MRWEDERYVRVYTRDTIAWKRLPWQSRALLPLILRIADRAGLVDLENYGAEGLAELVMLPVEVVQYGLMGLINDGTVTLKGGILTVVNFIKAQEVPISDAQRKRDQRERDRARSLETKDDTVTNVTPVTDTRDTSRFGHSVPICSVPSEPSVTLPSEEGVADAPPAARAQQTGFKLDDPEPEDASTGAQREMAEAVTHYQRRWIEVFRPVDGKPPTLTGADRGQLRAMLKAHGIAVWRDYLERYLVDVDAIAVKNAHALSVMSRFVNGYRVTTKASTVGHAKPAPHNTETKEHEL